MSEQRPDKPCCEAWAKAHKSSTDNEGFGSLVHYEDGKAEIGCRLPPVNYCPWCGAEMSRERMEYADALLWNSLTGLFLIGLGALLMLVMWVVSR